jgi:hypothetical protein
MAESGEKPGSFKVTDRRSFDGSGERKEDAPAGQDPPTSAEPAKVEPSQPAASEPTKTEAPRSLPPADFATLVLSLGSSAIMYLGESGGDAGGGKTVERNLPMAKHAIDLLTVLEDKTKGNLSAEESHILESLLFDLRLRYVEELKASPPGV